MRSQRGNEENNKKVSSGSVRFGSFGWWMVPEVVAAPAVIRLRQSGSETYHTGVKPPRHRHVNPS